MRTRFKLIVLAGIAVEMKNFLSVLVLRHGVSPSVLSARSVDLAFWNDAGTLASSGVSASCYSGSENVRIIAVVLAD